MGGLKQGICVFMRAELCKQSHLVSSGDHHPKRWKFPYMGPHKIPSLFGRVLAIVQIGQILAIILIWMSLGHHPDSAAPP